MAKRLSHGKSLVTIKLVHGACTFGAKNLAKQMHLVNVQNRACKIMHSAIRKLDSLGNLKTLAHPSSVWASAWDNGRFSPPHKRQAALVSLKMSPFNLSRRPACCRFFLGMVLWLEATLLQTGVKEVSAMMNVNPMNEEYNGDGDLIVSIEMNMQ